MEQQLQMGFPRAVPGKHRAPLQACRRSSQLHTAGGHRGAGFLVHSQYWRIQVLVPGYLLALLWITAGSACNRSSEAPGGNPTRRAHSPAAPGDRSALPKRSARLLAQRRGAGAAGKRRRPRAQRDRRGREGARPRGCGARRASRPRPRLPHGAASARC